MTIVEKTIGSGKDHATVTLWEANVGNFGTDTYKGIIQESVEFNESVDLTGGTGTPSITSYLWLTTDPANRHAGVAGTGHGRMRANDGNHVITINANFTRVDWLEIQQDGGGTSDEGVRLKAVTDVLVDYCIVWTNDDANDQDGFYADAGSDTLDIRISNCIVYGFKRSQIHPQYSTSLNDYSSDVDHCTLIHTSASGDNENGAIFIRSNKSAQVMTQTIYNTIGYMELAADEPFADGTANNRDTPVGTVTWNGSHNLRGDQGTGNQIDGTDNTTNWQSATDGDTETSQSSGSFVVFKDITAGSEDFRLLDAAAGNLAAGNGTDRQGSEPDSRQDFSIDITGGSRPTTGVDIGAHQVSAAGGAPFPRRQLATVRM